jgi:hypothetical protein
VRRRARVVPTIAAITSHTGTGRGKTRRVLTPEQRAEFDRTGIVKLPGAFERHDAERMQAVLWDEMARRYGIERDDTSTWYRHAPTRLTTTKKSRAFASILGSTVTAALDDLLGAGRWQAPKHFGNVLVTMPNAREWRVPHAIWHADFGPEISRERLPVVKVWALFDDVAPGGGGTPQLAGSHRAFARYLERTGECDYKRAKFGFLASHPCLRALSHPDDDPRRNERFMEEGAEVDGEHLAVVECTGNAGDAYVTHPWVYHSIADNATPRPRLMRSVQVRARPAAVLD